MTPRKEILNWSVDHDNEISYRYGPELEKLSRIVLQGEEPYRDPRCSLVDAGYGCASILVTCVLKDGGGEKAVLANEDHMFKTFGEKLGEFMVETEGLKLPFYTPEPISLSV